MSDEMLNEFMRVLGQVHEMTHEIDRITRRNTQSVEDAKTYSCCDGKKIFRATGYDTRAQDYHDLDFGVHSSLEICTEEVFGIPFELWVWDEGFNRWEFDEIRGLHLFIEPIVVNSGTGAFDSYKDDVARHVLERK